MQVSSILIRHSIIVNKVIIDKKESKYYKELKLTWKRDYWTWDRIHNMGRNSSDAGVRMECERLAVKIVKGIPLIENDIRYLNRTNANTISKTT